MCFSSAYYSMNCVVFSAVLSALSNNPQYQPGVVVGGTVGCQTSWLPHHQTSLTLRHIRMYNCSYSKYVKVYWLVGCYWFRTFHIWQIFKGEICCESISCCCLTLLCALGRYDSKIIWCNVDWICQPFFLFSFLIWAMAAVSLFGPRCTKFSRSSLTNSSSNRISPLSVSCRYWAILNNCVNICKHFVKWTASFFNVLLNTWILSHYFFPYYHIKYPWIPLKVFKGLHRPLLYRHNRIHHWDEETMQPFHKPQRF